MIDLEEQQRMERRKLKVGDRVAVVGRRGRIDVQTVTANFGSSVLVGRFEYWTWSGNAVGQLRASVLRGLATQDEVNATDERIVGRQEKN
jgi:hypothetical protein